MAVKIKFHTQLRMFCRKELQDFFKEHKVAEITTFRLKKYHVHISSAVFRNLIFYLREFAKGREQAGGYIWKRVKQLGVVEHSRQLDFFIKGRKFTLDLETDDQWLDEYGKYNWAVLEN